MTPAYSPMQLKHRGKIPLVARSIPPAASSTSRSAPRETSKFPYHRGKRRPFRYTPAGISRRAQTIVERVQAGRD